MGNVKSNLNQGFELNQEVVDSSARLAGKLSKGCRVRVVGFEQEAIVTGFDSAHVWAAIDGHIGKYIKTTVYMPGEEPPKPRLLVSAASSASSGSLGMPGSIQAQPQSREVIPASDPAIQKVFGKYDKDGSGQMEAKELRSCLRQLNVLVDDAEGDEVISKYDTDGDGHISAVEFQAIVRELEGLRAKYTTDAKKAKSKASMKMPAPSGKNLLADAEPAEAAAAPAAAAPAAAAEEPGALRSAASVDMEAANVELAAAGAPAIATEGVQPDVTA